MLLEERRWKQKWSTKKNIVVVCKILTVNGKKIETTTVNVCKKLKTTTVNVCTILTVVCKKIETNTVNICKILTVNGKKIETTTVIV